MKLRYIVWGLLVTILAGTTATFFYVSLWKRWVDGKIISHGENSRMNITSEIIVRELPTTTAFWGPIFPMLEDNYRYELIYRRLTPPMFFSKQDVSGHSLRVTNCKIEWTNEGNLLVTLNQVRIYECNPNGDWKKIE